MNCKAKGTRNEYKSIRLLEAAGYICTRAAASLGVFDIVAISETDILLVQVKSNRRESAVEREQIEMFPCPTNARKLIHVWRDRIAAPYVYVIGTRRAHEENE